MTLLERDEALVKLIAAQEKAREGTGNLVLVSGEAGIGKTTLLTNFVQNQPLQVLWGSCDALFIPRPLGPLYDIVGQTSEQLAAMLQDSRDRPALFSAFLHTLHTPTVLIIEDIHWADEATLDLLKYLGRRIQTTCSLLIVTFRDDALGRQHPLRLLLGDFARLAEVQRIRLESLSETAVSQLVGKLPIHAKTLHAQTGGNPFFVTEVLVADGADMPSNVRDAVLARVVQLSRNGRDVLDMAAVIGQRIDLTLLEKATGTKITAVEESLKRGVLLVQGSHVAFRHEIARQIILNEMLPINRRVLHQIILDILKTELTGQKNYAQIAHHAEAAGDREAILTYAPLAAKVARQTGMPRAEANLWALTIQYAERLSLIKQAELHEDHGLSCRSQADKSVSIEAYRRALGLAARAEAPPHFVGRILVRLATMLVTNAQVDEAVETIDEAFALLEPLPPSTPLALAYKNRAYQLLIRGFSEEAILFAEKGYVLAQQLEDIYTIMSTLDMLGLCWLPSDHARGQAYMEQTLTLALKNDGFWRAASIYPNLSKTYVNIYALDRAEKLIEEGLIFFTEHDNDLAQFSLRAWAGMLKLYQGKWGEASQIIDELIAEPRLPLSCQAATFTAYGRLLARQGRDGAQEILDKALKAAKKNNNLQRMGAVYIARAEAAWLRNDPQQLLAEVDAFYEVALKNRQPSFAAELAYWRWQAGEPVETLPWMIEPLILEINGDWQAAAVAWETLGCPYEQARALASGDAEAQKAALLIFERLGAKPMIVQVRQSLQAAGVRVIPRGPKSTTQKNPFRLTNRQLQILRLLMENLTNAEIAKRLHISPKTVDHHVSAVLGKLQVSSRKEAAAVGRERLDG